jgi:steroid delta-isomerase-like uncharacterized protein
MDYLDTAKRYLDAWNTHDADAILKTFAAAGTYSDPTTGEIWGDAIGANAKRLWSAFPDLSFEIVSIAEADASRVVVEWIMKGTNTESFQGLPPTGRSVSLPGVDVIEIGGDGIKAVKGYFDTRAVPDQLGLQVLVQPFEAGPFAFGNSISVQSGKKTKPGAFGITTIWNADRQTEEIRAANPRNGNGDVAHGRIYRSVVLQDRWPRCHDFGVGKTGAHETVDARRHPFGSNAKIFCRTKRCWFHERVGSGSRQSFVGPVHGMPQNE